MSGSTRNPAANPANAPYSQEFPSTPEERERAQDAARRVAEDKQGKPAPQQPPPPFDGTTHHGTEDPSRFSTPPPPKP